MWELYVVVVVVVIVDDWSSSGDGGSFGFCDLVDAAAGYDSSLLDNLSISAPN